MTRIPTPLDVASEKLCQVVTVLVREQYSLGFLPFLAHLHRGWWSERRRLCSDRVLQPICGLDTI